VGQLRCHTVEHVSLSQVCEDAGIQPTHFYQWLKEFFENGAAMLVVDLSFTCLSIPTRFGLQRIHTPKIFSKPNLRNPENPENLLSWVVQGGSLPRKLKRTSDWGTFLTRSSCLGHRMDGEDLELNSAGQGQPGLNVRRELRRRTHRRRREEFRRSRLATVALGGVVKTSVSESRMPECRGAPVGHLQSFLDASSPMDPFLQQGCILEFWQAFSSGCQNVLFRLEKSLEKRKEEKKFQKPVCKEQGINEFDRF